MVLNPFWVGVWATVSIEMALVFIMAFIATFKK